MAELNAALNNEVAQGTVDADAQAAEIVAAGEGLEPELTNEGTVNPGNSDQLNEELGILTATNEEAPEPIVEAPKVKTPSRFQDRIDVLTKQRGDAETRAYRAEAELQSLKSEFGKLGPEPKEDDFEKYSDYVKSVTKWTAKQEAIELKTGQVQESVNEIQRTDREFQTAKMHDGMERYADFGQKAATLGRILEPGSEAYQALFESPEFVEVAYFLSNNLQEAARIQQLPTRLQAKEILRLEAKFEGGVTPTPTAQPLPTPTPASKVSQAPAPARQVLTGKAPGTQRVSPEKESMEAYAARRNRELRAQK